VESAESERNYGTVTASSSIVLLLCTFTSILILPWWAAQQPDTLFCAHTHPS
jgi:hypothetical protein